MIDRRQLHAQRAAALAYYRLLMLCGVRNPTIHADIAA